MEFYPLSRIKIEFHPFIRKKRYPLNSLPGAYQVHASVPENKPKGQNDESLGFPLTEPSYPLVKVFTQVWYFISSSHVHLTKQTLGE